MHPVAFGKRHMICHCLLLETDQHGLVLIDAGFGVRDFEDPTLRCGKVFPKITRVERNADHAALSQVRALGFKGEDVRHIVLTHMDLDHVGGLVDFPHATVHVHAVEHDLAMTRPTTTSRQRYRPVMWEHNPTFSTYSDLGEPWFGFDAVRQLDGLPPEVLLVPLVGHTRGHTGVAIQAGDGWLLHAGDAYFARGEVHAPERECPPTLRIFQSLVEMDRKARLTNQTRLRQLAASTPEVRVFSAHDPSEML